jgi:acetyl-CoA carboxylase biotin carboxyl carrier protein
VAFLNFKEILELIDKVADRELSAVEIESAGLRLRVEGRKQEPPQVTWAPVEHRPQSAAPQYAQPQGAPAPATPLPAAAAPAEEESDANVHIITSPIVGTFYRSPNPEAEPFASVGDRVSKGSVICIIEAMKLMNEIESDVDGVIMKVFPQTGQPIEYGEKLFAIRL